MFSGGLTTVGGVRAECGFMGAVLEVAIFDHALSDAATQSVLQILLPRAGMPVPSFPLQEGNLRLAKRAAHASELPDSLSRVRSPNTLQQTEGKELHREEGAAAVPRERVERATMDQSKRQRGGTSVTANESEEVNLEDQGPQEEEHAHPNTKKGGSYVAVQLRGAHVSDTLGTAVRCSIKGVQAAACVRLMACIVLYTCICPSALEVLSYP
jgi:hypothetical protein